MAKQTVYVEEMGGKYFDASDILDMIRKLTDYLEEINNDNEGIIEELESENDDLKVDIATLQDANEELKDRIEELEGE